MEALRACVEFVRIPHIVIRPGVMYDDDGGDVDGSLAMLVERCGVGCCQVLDITLGDGRKCRRILETFTILLCNVHVPYSVKPHLKDQPVLKSTSILTIIGMQRYICCMPRWHTCAVNRNGAYPRLLALGFHRP
jgi:hypothetical protein